MRWDSHYALALAYERSGSISEAIAEFRKVLTLHPDDLDGYWASEQIAVLLPEENKQEAIELLQRAVEINQRAHVDPKNAAAKALERLLGD
jgi:tetratricopeptide (TPR) repeat protein